MPKSLNDGIVLNIDNQPLSLMDLPKDVLCLIADFLNLEQRFFSFAHCNKILYKICYDDNSIKRLKKRTNDFSFFRKKITTLNQEINKLETLKDLLGFEKTTYVGHCCFITACSFLLGSTLYFLASKNLEDDKHAFAYPILAFFILLSIFSIVGSCAHLAANCEKNKMIGDTDRQILLALDEQRQILNVIKKLNKIAPQTAEPPLKIIIKP